MLSEHVRDPLVERDLTWSSCPETEDNFSQGFVNNNQTQSGSHYLYTETDYIEIPLAEIHNNSLAWYGVDGCKLIFTSSFITRPSHLLVDTSLSSSP